MSWLRLDDQFHRHRKVAPLSDKAFRLHVTVMLECASQLTDGKIECALVPTLPQAPTTKAALKKVTDELVRAGLWKKSDQNWIVHDFQDWNPPASNVLAKREEAKERMRLAREAKEARRRESEAARSQNVRANKTRTEREQNEMFAECSLNPVPVPISKEDISTLKTCQVSNDRVLPTDERESDFDFFDPVFDEPAPQTHREPLAASSSQPVTLALVEPPELQEAAERLLSGGGRAENARQRRGGTANRWPEIRRLVELDVELRGEGDYPRTEGDGRVQKALKRYSEGFTPEELEDVIRRAHADEFWSSKGLHVILADPANFAAMGKSRKRKTDTEEVRAEQHNREMAEAASKWR